MQWVNGIWQADRIAWKTNSYQLKFADQLYFTTQSWGGATGTNGTAIVSAAGNNINFTLTQAGLYNVRFNPTNLAYSITLDWAERDVGTVSAVGSSLSLGDNSFLLRSSGADIEGTADEFHYLYQTRSGDLLMQTKITSLTPTHGWAKAGLMIRQNNTNANTRYAAVLLTASNGVSFQSRSSTGGTNTISITGGIGAPVWLRLKKSSTSFQSFYSTDGKSWSEIGSSRTVGSTANWSTFTAGLAGTSHLDGVLTEASFDELSIRTNTASSLIITPNPPVRGRNVTLAYYADGRSLAGSDDVSLIASHSGSYDLLTPAPQMTGISPDVWSYTYPVPYNATSISLSFSNSAGLIDTGGTFSTAAPTTSAQSAPTNTPTRPQGPNLQPYAVGSGFKFIWDAVPSQNGIAPIYRVTTTKNGQTSTAITGLNEFTVQGTAGDLFSISVQAVYPYDFSQSGPASLTSLSTTLLLPDTDQDGDGLSNTAEQVAGTDPFDSQSNFEVSSITRVGASQISVEWKSVPGKKYQVQWCSSLSDGFTNPANATLVLSASAGSTTTWTDLSASGSARFYRVIVVP